jgi:hypothetical protein
VLGKHQKALRHKICAKCFRLDWDCWWKTNINYIKPPACFIDEAEAIRNRALARSNHRGVPHFTKKEKRRYDQLMKAKKK